MTIPTVQEVEDFKVDLDDAEAIVNGSTTVTTRLGGDKESLDQLLSKIVVGDVVAYNAASTYTLISEWIEESGVIYRPLPSALPIGPEAFNSANWSVVQGYADAENTDLTIDGTTTKVSAYLNSLEYEMVFETIADMQTGNRLNGLPAVFSEGQVLRVLNMYDYGVTSCDFVVVSGVPTVPVAGHVSFALLGGPLYALVKPRESSGTQNSNIPSLYADRNTYEFGQEYMWAFHKVMYNQNATAEPAIADVVFSGDSTTFGVGSIEPLSTIYQKCAYRIGSSTVYARNRGNSGAQTTVWNSTHVASDIAAYPNMRLYVARWGVNDASRITADGFETTIDTYRTALRGGLAQLRAFKSVKLMSILLMTPNTISDSGQPRNIRWLEAIRDVVIEAARDYQCGFIDTYAMWRDGYRDAWDDAWLANDISGGGVHPDVIFNHWIASKVADFTLKPLEHRSYNNFFNIPAASAKGPVLTTDLPYFYDYGVSINRAETGWPINGTVVTTRTADGIWKQENFGNSSTVNRRSAFRYAESLTVWGPWLTRTAFILLNGWITKAGNTSPIYQRTQEGIVHLEMTLDGSSKTSDTVGNLPASFRPATNQRFITFNNDGTVTGVVQIGSNGDVIPVGGTVSDIAIRCSFFAQN